MNLEDEEDATRSSSTAELYILTLMNVQYVWIILVHISLFRVVTFVTTRNSHTCDHTEPPIHVGKKFYKQIIKDATDWIKPGGYLVIEIGETQANSILKLMQNELHYDEIEIINDLQGKERIISAKIK